MDNVFTQVLIQEIENLNLRYSQLTLANWKLGQFQKENPTYGEYTTDQKENYHHLVNTGTQLIDELKISITQILIRMNAIAQKIRIPKEDHEEYNKLAAQIYDSKSPQDKDLIDFISKSNQIYINNLLTTPMENPRDSVKQFTRG